MPRRRGRGAARTVLAVAAIAGSYLAVRAGTAEPLDRRATELAARPLGPGVDRVVGTATDLASVYGLTGISAVLAAAGRRRAALDAGASGLLAWTVAQAVKPALPRERPYETADAARLVAPPAGTSWPSGHTAVAAAMTAALGPQLSRRGVAAADLATAAVGLSRLYVGVHHLTDLAAGWGIGVLSARAWALLRRRHRRRRRRLRDLTTPGAGASGR